MSNKLFAALSLAGTIALTLPFIARTEKFKDSAPPATLVKSTPVVAASVSATDDLPQVVSVEVTPTGFQPNETTARSGRFLILVQNRSGNRELSFYLVRENQQRLAESEPQNRDWKAQVQLGPGTYIIGERSHPEWQSIIRVSN